MLRRGSIVALAALALAGSAAGGLLSGCDQADEVSGNLTKAQYVLEMRALANRVREQTKLAVELVNVGSLKDALPVIEKAVAEFDEVVSDLEDIDPPDEIAALHNRLTSALGSASNLLTNAEKAVKQSDIASLIVLAPQLNQFREDFRGIVGDFDAQGYSLDSGEPATTTP